MLRPAAVSRRYSISVDPKAALRNDALGPERSVDLAVDQPTEPGRIIGVAKPDHRRGSSALAARGRSGPARNTRVLPAATLAPSDFRFPQQRVSGADIRSAGDNSVGMAANPVASGGELELPPGIRVDVLEIETGELQPSRHQLFERVPHLEDAMQG